jgi:hypothetical protein
MPNGRSSCRPLLPWPKDCSAALLKNPRFYEAMHQPFYAALIPYAPKAMPLYDMNTLTGDALFSVYGIQFDGTLVCGCIFGHAGGDIAMTEAITRSIIAYIRQFIIAIATS